MYDIKQIKIDKENLTISIENNIEKNSDCVMPFLSEMSIVINRIQKFLYNKIAKNDIPPLIMLNFKINEDSMKITPYLLERSILNAVSKCTGTVNILSIDIGDMNSKAFVKYSDIKNFRKLLNNIENFSNRSFEELSKIIDNKSVPSIENPEVINSAYLVNIKNKLQIVFKLDVISIYEKYGEQFIFELLHCLNNSESIKGIILDSSIKSYDNFIMKTIEFNSVESRNKLIKSLGIVNNYNNKYEHKVDKNKKKLKVITSDGVTSSKDIINYNKLGADLVLFTTIFTLKGPLIFDNICEDLKNEYKNSNNK